MGHLIVFKKNLTNILKRVDQFCKKIYRAIEDNQDILKAAEILLDKYLLVVCLFVMFGFTFWDCLGNCYSEIEVYLYFSGLALVGFSLSAIGKLFSMCMKRIIFLLTCYFFMLQIYLYVDSSILDSFMVFGLGIYVFSILLVLEHKCYTVIPVLCLLAQILDVRFVLLYFPGIVSMFLMQSFKNETVSTKSPVFCVLCMVVSQIAGTVVHGFLLNKTPWISNHQLLLNNSYLHFNIIILLLVIYASFYVYQNILENVGEKNRKMKAFAFFLPIITSSAVIVFLSQNMVYYYTMLVAVFGTLLMQNASIISHIDFIRYKMKKSNFFMVFLFAYTVIKVILQFRIVGLNKDNFSIAMYYIDYQTYGFVQRGLIGTLYRVFGGYIIPVHNLMTTATYIYFITAICIMLLLFHIISNLKEGYLKILAFLFLCMYFVSPAFLTYFSKAIMTRFDMYNMLIALVCIWLLIKNRYLYLLPFLCTLSIFIHQVSLFIISPIVFVFLVYRAIIDPGKHAVRNKIVLAITLFSVCGWFIYFQFFSQSNIMISAKEANQVLNIRSAGYFVEEQELINDVIVADLNHHLTKYHDRIEMSQVVQTLKYMVYFLPIITTYFYAFFASAKFEKKKGKKIIYQMIPFSFIAFLPCYILETDYGRWNAHFLMHIILSILFLTVLQENSEKKWYDNIKKRYLIIWCSLIVLMLAGLSPFNYWI